MEYVPEVIDETPDYVQHLRSLVHPRDELQKRGYIVNQLSQSDLDKKRRCRRCYKALAKARKRGERLSGPGAAGSARKYSTHTRAKSENNFNNGSVDVSKLFGSGGSQAGTPSDSSASKDNPFNSFTFSMPADGIFYSKTAGNGNSSEGSYSGVNSQSLETAPQTSASYELDTEAATDTKDGSKPCRYHPGIVSYRKWTCCKGPPMSKPCSAEEDHEPIQYEASALQDNWRFYTTPPAVDAKGRRQPRAVAVAIDCEMGVSDIGESELIRVSVVDFFTGAVLLDSLVFPDVKMQHYNTRFSGVTRQAMQEARRRRTCLFGRKRAREAIWRIVGPETIVIGHAANSDLTSLRWIHNAIADTLVIEQTIVQEEKTKAEIEAGLKAEASEELEEGEEAPKLEYVSRGLSLKALAHDRLEREIQIRGQGHDSVEDALAARDLIHWHVSNRLATEDVN